MSSLESQYSLAKNSVVLFELSFHRLFRISGKDAVRYLHGRLTNDIKDLSSNIGLRSLLLTPNGRVQGQLIVLCQGENFLLLSDPLVNDKAVDDFIQALLQFKVADLLEVTPLDSHRIFSLQGPKAKKLLEEHGAKDLPSTAFGHKSVDLMGIPLQIVVNPRGAPEGFDLIFEKNLGPSLKQLLLEQQKEIQIGEGSEEGRLLLRIIAKLPEFPYDINEKTLAPDIDLSSLVSFNKGCYAGQEVVEMATSRGKPNRRLVLFEGKGTIAFQPGTDIYQASSSDEKETKSCGVITSSCILPSKNKVLALGFVKFAVDDKSPLIAQNIPLQVCQLPNPCA